LPENRYRKYIKLSKEDVLSKIKEELEGMTGTIKNRTRKGMSNDDGHTGTHTQ
jgi:ATP-dependent helicase/nuclease subunit B